jgi:signal peptidase II
MSQDDSQSNDKPESSDENSVSTSNNDAVSTDETGSTKSAETEAAGQESEIESKDEAPAEGAIVVAKKKVVDPPPPPPTAREWAFLGVLAGVTAGLDIWSKFWAVKRLSMASIRPVPLCVPPPGAQHYFYQRIPHNELVLSRNYLELRYAENCGGAWGLMHNWSEKVRRPFFFLITIAAIAFVVHLYRSLEKDQHAMRVALPLVLGGAIGNLFDRLRLGYVVDFIRMHFKDKYDWPTYNVADIAITVGIILMVIEFLGIGRKRPTAASAAKPAESKVADASEAAA